VEWVRVDTRSGEVAVFGETTTKTVTATATATISAATMYQAERRAGTRPGIRSASALALISSSFRRSSSTRRP
jgi:hypothetical protein